MYKLISGKDLTEFNRNLRNHVNEGYTPFGSISVVSCSMMMTYTLLMKKDEK